MVYNQICQSIDQRQKAGGPKTAPKLELEGPLKIVKKQPVETLPVMDNDSCKPDNMQQNSLGEGQVTEESRTNRYTSVSENVENQIMEQRQNSGSGSGGSGQLADDSSFDQIKPVETKDKEKIALERNDPNYERKKKKKQSSVDQLSKEHFKKTGERESVIWCDKDGFVISDRYEGLMHKYDSNKNPIFKIKTKNGQTIIVEFAQALNKYYHADVFDLKFPSNFDRTKLDRMSQLEKIQYLEKFVSKNEVLKFQMEIARSLRDGNFERQPGYLGVDKIPGFVYKNVVPKKKSLVEVHFVDANGNWRTTALLRKRQWLATVLNAYHLFRKKNI